MSTQEEQKKRNDGWMLTDKREKKKKKEHSLYKSRPVLALSFFFLLSTYFMVMGPSDRQHIT